MTHIAQVLTGEERVGGREGGEDVGWEGGKEDGGREEEEEEEGGEVGRNRREDWEESVEGIVGENTMSCKSSLLIFLQGDWSAGE